MPGKKELSSAESEYKKFSESREPKRPFFKNAIRAFFVGGLICSFAEILQWFFIRFVGFSEKNAGNPTAVVIILISVLLTGLGVFDHIGQWSGAGTAVPITGFANSIASAAIEHRSEGYVLGVGGNMFKLAGSVFAFGVFSAFVVGIISVIIRWIGGM